LICGLAGEEDIGLQRLRGERDGGGFGEKRLRWVVGMGERRRCDLRGG
jgi:hypothetical protein